MIRDLALKPDFARTVARFAAWWERDVVDRPPVTLGVAPSRPYTGPTSHHDSARERWLDVEFAVESGIARLLQHDHVGDTLPVILPSLGPAVSATFHGAELRFAADASETEPIVREPEDWCQVLDSPPELANPYWRAVERMTDLAIERSEGRYLVGLAGMYGNFDVLAALRGAEALCLDVMDRPEVLRRAASRVTQGFAAAFRRLHAKLARAGLGCTPWIPFTHDGPAAIASCDFWCLVSQNVARELIAPALLREIEPLERCLFHLDGPDALRHLDLVLEMPGVHAVQWDPGVGGGPAARWLPVYERILAAGKAAQVVARDADDALDVLDGAGARGLWLNVEAAFASVDDAEAFLREVERRAQAQPLRGRARRTKGR